MQFYRYEIHDHGEEKADPNIVLIKFFLVKETPKGYWIRSGISMKRRWIPKESKKRYAYPDKSSALLNLVKRTEHSIWYLERRLKCAQLGLEKAIEMGHTGEIHTH